MITVYWLWRLGVFLTGVLPRRWSRVGAKMMGNGAYYLMPARRRVAKDNFAYVLAKSPDDPEVRRVARHSFQNYARYLHDVMIYPRTSVAELEQRVSLYGTEHAERALALGKGVILVSVNFGNMDITSAVVAKQYKPMTLVAETLRPPQLMDYLIRMRSARNVHLYPYDRAPRKLIEALRRNEFVGFLLDFGVTHHLDIATVTVNFFNIPTQFPAGPAQLAFLTGAPIIVCHAHATANGHINARASEPIFVPRRSDRQHVFQETMQQVAKRLEEFIRAHPEQWYIFRPMWRNGNYD